jgi:hypothetical protein
MVPMYDPHPWSKQRREEAIREAQLRSLTRQVRRDHGAPFGLDRVVCALSGVLSLLR